MRIVPAVDIRGGRCVNLVQGDYDRETVFSDEPVDQARRWFEAVRGLIHIVDLDGAREGRLCALGVLRNLHEAGIPFEIGGGIRAMADVDSAAAAGAGRVILGTAAYRDPEFLQQAIARYPGKIAVGVDARDGRVALSAWRDTTDRDAVEFARDMQRAGAARIIYTDINSDGMMKGPNFAATGAVARALTIPVTASGGVSSIEDVRRLKELEPDGVDEVIIGRALYLGAINLAEAVAVAEGGS
ncbi:MAG TPA: 1-(5-phosphoribosyl)-5-[(5-phosphoribosylamino)methylideneamino]imidazole-4-carboxamide isomerase [Candidatus Hydrogenedentes bacterium]|nr:1-(5-phosphoribosyl)-5-[(5-phosphoribosylamino)methylideneamino]imidazole-4-carboxamide isomerase [Candidatus Hydrogenedentota bacterium]HQH69254.1 1-(5-phosphoribosyl)-5-[(5-phosphoribosylamino)methylideneamino]imidazole-4-carboxamide isomerase [Candidatus Hydrogenedentota bacterium]HQM50893.1 1-(5-phosphoribosyl)-5-[(5-phosphoribosylamino)methylideneamino]imidazole-4-carboxamide isomerase [Candidatus Hydrogenedentota bacterium]